MIDHDAKPGPLTRCQISGSANLDLIIDLGHQPPCDALLSRDQLNAPEVSYPLRLFHCPESGLAQLDYVVDGATIYPPSYPYRSGISKPLEEYQRAFANGVLNRWALVHHTPFVVDIGSNDGTLLSGFKAGRCRTLGIEPTDVAKIARVENGIETIQAFFTEKLAREIVIEHGRAAFITMTNVFAHMAGLGEVMRGIDQLLARDGIFITESHYLLDVLEKNQFDTIYHEHIRTYSLKALICLAEQYGMEVFDVERRSRYGGNIRAYIARKGQQRVWPSVGVLLALEERAGLHTPEAWKRWRDRVAHAKDCMMNFLSVTHMREQLVLGNSCPGRASTLINYFGITPELVPYLGELHNSLKLGKYLPGKHIPIVSNKRIIEDQPRFLILFAWHYSEAIIARLKAEGVRSKIVMPLPQFAVL